MEQWHWTKTCLQHRRVRARSWRNLVWIFGVRGKNCSFYWPFLCFKVRMMNSATFFFALSWSPFTDLRVSKMNWLVCIQHTTLGKDTLGLCFTQKFLQKCLQRIFAFHHRHLAFTYNVHFIRKYKMYCIALFLSVFNMSCQYRLLAEKLENVEGFYLQLNYFFNYLLSTN